MYSTNQPAVRKKARYDTPHTHINIPMDCGTAYRKILDITHNGSEDTGRPEDVVRSKDVR